MPWRAGVDGDEEPGSMGNEGETAMKTTYAMNTMPVFPIAHQDRISIIDKIHLRRLDFSLQQAIAHPGFGQEQLRFSRIVFQFGA